ncbi:MAG: 6-phosphogluconolactonase [Candidatus Saccharimonadia bacterium]
MNVIQKPYSAAVETIETELRSMLLDGQVLLLLSGGSATKVYRQLTTSLGLNLLPGDLVVGLVDERYEIDPLHSDANDKTIRETGLVSHLEELGAIYAPILHGLPISAEVAQYEFQLNRYIFHENRQILAILGLGSDGHTAGILPDENKDSFKEHFLSSSLVTGYLSSGPYPERITLSITALKLIQTAIVLIADQAKHDMLDHILDPANHQKYNELPGVIFQDLPRTIILK